jgi:hypothetical protein
MNNKLFTLLAVTATALTISACSSMNNPADLPPGKYEKTSTSVDTNGTERQTTNTTDVQYDANGNKKAVVTSKQTTDPKGLFNKTTNESETTYEQDR